MKITRNNFWKEHHGWCSEKTQLVPQKQRKNTCMTIILLLTIITVGASAGGGALYHGMINGGYVIYIAYAEESVLLVTNETAKLIASDGAKDDWFGFSVSVSGDTAIIGAVHDDNSRGSAYVFEKNSTSGNWTQKQKLTASDGAEEDRFGHYVSIYNNTAVIGALWNDDKRGSAYVFEKNSTSGNWTQKQKLTASDGAEEDRFGNCVSVYNNTAVIGAFINGNNSKTNSGSAYIFERNTDDGSWPATETQKLTASDGAEEDRFGWCVFVSGVTAVIGAPYNDDKRGSAYVFEKNSTSGNWTQKQKLTASDGAEDDFFGNSVSVYNNTAVIGVHDDDDKRGSAYVFEKNSTSGNWTQKQKLTASDGAEEDRFGQYVSVYNNTAVIGAFHDDDKRGSAYVFEYSSGNWMQTAKLTASDGEVDDWFGQSVSVYNNTAVIGADHDDDDDGLNFGSAYVFTISANQIPTAHAGDDQTVDEGTDVTLNGTATDPDTDDTITYLWSQTKGPTVTLSNSTSESPMFGAPLINSDQTILTFSLTVNDGAVDSTPDTVDITVLDTDDVLLTFPGSLPGSSGSSTSSIGTNGGGGGSSSGGGGSRDSSIQIDDIYIRSVSWDCNAGTIKIIAGPDSEYLSVAVRTTQLGVHQASIAADNQISGYKTFVSSMAQTENYIGIQAVAQYGRNVNVVNESINVDSCVGEKTYSVPGDDDLSTATTTTKQQLAPSTVDPEPTTAAPSAVDPEPSTAAPSAVDPEPSTAAPSAATTASSSSPPVDPEPEPPVCGPGTEVADGFCRIIIPSEGEEPEENGGSSSSSTSSGGGGGCLIATAAYGTELAPQVQFLREIRENTVLQTQSGSAFMDSFNLFYYSFSPGIADLERQNPIFREAVKIAITPMISSLAILGYADIDSESEMLAYGIGIVALNIGLYVVLPVSAMYCVAARFGGVMFAKSGAKDHF